MWAGFLELCTFKVVFLKKKLSTRNIKIALYIEMKHSNSYLIIFIKDFLIQILKYARIPSTSVQLAPNGLCNIRETSKAMTAIES